MANSFDDLLVYSIKIQETLVKITIETTNDVSSIHIDIKYNGDTTVSTVPAIQDSQVRSAGNVMTERPMDLSDSTPTLSPKTTAVPVKLDIPDPDPIEDDGAGMTFEEI